MKAVAYSIVTSTALALACYAPSIADRMAMVCFACVFAVATIFTKPQP